MTMKRIAGIIETVFDVAYLMTAIIIGIILFADSSRNIPRLLASTMAGLLIIGDAFHLLPRLLFLVRPQEETLTKYLGTGKQITSITMTLFYVLLWQIGMLLFAVPNEQFWTIIMTLLAIVRIGLCLIPQNNWQQRQPPLNFAIYRNIPFLIQGILVGVLFFLYRSAIPNLNLIWLAVSLSFLFYIPVVLFSNKFPLIGILMLPKTVAYVWILIMMLSL